MPRKTTILIVILIAVTAVLLFLALREKQSLEDQVKQNVKVIPTQKPVNKSSSIYFEPKVVTATSGVQTADVVVTSGTNKVTGVQLEMSFDPTQLADVTIAEPKDTSFFGGKESYVVLFKNVDYQKGRISYAIAITPSEEPKTGTGKVATISFVKKVGADKAQTQIIFLNKTMVTELGVGESVLKTQTPLLVNFSQSSQSGQACAQVITPAKNSATGECRDFPTPCDVPSGWIKVASCQ